MARMTKERKAEMKAQQIAAAARRKEQLERDTAIVRSGVCPQCGAGIRRNNSMTGWYQCEQFGAEGFRRDASKPSCSWQTFIY